MRFRDSPQFNEVFDSIRRTLARYGLAALRADMRVYSPDGDLWDNICIYMLGCRYGVCVFEELDDRHFSPNVPSEYGFMRALNRPVLLLKDQRMPQMPADITGKLFEPFDGYRITETIAEQVTSWCERDLGLKRMPEVRGLRRTCGACPSQWAGKYGQDDELVHIHFRSGWLSAHVYRNTGEPHSDDDLKEGVRMYEAYVGPDDLADDMEEHEMRFLLGHIFFFSE